MLTAVDDFMAEVRGLRLDVIPCIFGVGFLYPRDAAWADELAAYLAPWAGADLLDALERNRLMLYIRVIELQDAAERERAQRERVLAMLHDQLGARGGRAAHAPLAARAGARGRSRSRSRGESA